MNIALKRKKRAKRVHFQVRKACKNAALPRMIVYKSNLHLYVQIVDDRAGETLVSYSTLQEAKSISRTDTPKTAGTSDSAQKDSRKNMANKKQAALIGKVIAEKSLKAGIKKVAFDRGCRAFHGCVAEIARSARENGLTF